MSYPARVAVDASHDGVAKLAALGALVERLDHDGLAASVAPGQHDNDLARLDAVRRQERSTSRVCGQEGHGREICQVESCAREKVDKETNQEHQETIAHAGYAVGIVDCCAVAEAKAAERRLSRGE